MHAIKDFFARRPRLTTWLILALAMLVIFCAASGGAGLLPAQRLALAGVVVLLAGACAWIIYWD
jgi:hypothetical protein